MGLHEMKENKISKSEDFREGNKRVTINWKPIQGRSNL